MSQSPQHSDSKCSGSKDDQLTKLTKLEGWADRGIPVGLKNGKKIAMSLISDVAGAQMEALAESKLSLEAAMRTISECERFCKATAVISQKSGEKKKR